MMASKKQSVQMQIRWKRDEEMRLNMTRIYLSGLADIYGVIESFELKIEAL